MSIILRTIQRAHKLKCKFSSPCSVIRGSGFGNRSYAAEAVTKSPFESNILRILRNEIEYQADYAPPHQPETQFKSFTVEERPGEQVVTIQGKFGDNEDIKIDATMFDGFEQVPALDDDSSGVNVRLHISLVVDISKGKSGNELQFLCSAWPDGLDVEKVYILKRGQMPAWPYLGPHFRSLNPKIQEKLCEYLDTRGINNELSVFLHEYITNKDRIELLRWMDRLKSFVEK